MFFFYYDWIIELGEVIFTFIPIENIPRWKSLHCPLKLKTIDILVILYFKYPSKSSLNVTSPALSRIMISHQIDNYRRKLSIGRIKVQRQLQNKCQVRIAKNKTRQKMTVASLCTCTWLCVCVVEGWGIRCLCVFAVATTKTINAHTHNKNNKKQQQKRNVTNRATSTAHWLRTSETARGAAQGSANGAAKRPKRMSAAREHAHERAHSWERERKKGQSAREQAQG